MWLSWYTEESLLWALALSSIGIRVTRGWWCLDYPRSSPSPLPLNCVPTPYANYFESSGSLCILPSACQSSAFWISWLFAGHPGILSFLLFPTTGGLYPSVNNPWMLKVSTAVSHVSPGSHLSSESWFPGKKYTFPMCILSSQVKQIFVFH